MIDIESKSHTNLSSELINQNTLVPENKAEHLSSELTDVLQTEEKEFNTKLGFLLSEKHSELDPFDELQPSLNEGSTQQQANKEEQRPVEFKLGEDQLIERIAREEATREVESILSNIDYLQDQTVLSTYIESKIEHTLSDDDKITDTTNLDRFVKNRTAKQLEQELSNEKFISRNTRITHVISDKYDIEEHTVENIQNSIDKLNEFDNELIEYHQDRLEIREKWEKTESIVSMAIGAAVCFISVSYYSFFVSSLPRIIGLTLFVLSVVIGLGLITAPILGRRE
jgi:hypothetical protein